MTEIAKSAEITVHCYAGYRGEEQPRSFQINGRDILVKEILQQWQEPSCRCFMLKSNDDGSYCLRYDETSDSWQLV